MTQKIRIYLISALLVILHSPVSGQPADSISTARKAQAAEIVRAVASDPAFSQSVLSICVCTGDGERLASLNPDMMLVPASNMKLITTGAAIHTLGKDRRFETQLAYKGEIRNGTLYGDLYIIGKGDPTLGSRDSTAVPVEQTFARWGRYVEEAGIRKIDGHIVGDGRWFDGMNEEESWVWNDIGTYYGTGCSALMFYENIQAFNVLPGKNPGDPVDITPYYPAAPWMEFRYECSTGEKGTGDRLYMYTSDLAPVAAIRGTFGVDRGRKRVECSNKFPEYTCASYFTDWLRKKGVECTKGPADFKLKPGPSDIDSGKELTYIGTTRSVELKRIIYTTNHESNNLYAETLFRVLGKEMSGSATYGSSAKALERALQTLGVDTSKGIHIKDGSGLSRQNYASSDFFCRFLEAMMHSPAFEEYAHSLPSPGSNGTLEFNMRGYPEELRSRIKVKSGSMNGIRCYSGYIIPTTGAKDETIIFSILTGNCTSPNWKTRPLLDKLMAGLAEIN